MKISKLTNGLLVSLLLSASAVEADSDYPATDFQPKVVFQDSDYKHTGSVSSSKSKSSASTGEVSVADSNYPAANFQPEVLFEDKAYKHAKGSVKSSSASSSGSSSSSYDSTEGASGQEAGSDDSSMSLIMGLAVLAIAGFVFYSKNNVIKLPAKKSASKRAPVRRAAAAVKPAGDGSVSGVAKYLESKGEVEPSGVAKYLDDRDSSSPVSGVAKYVAKKKISARLASVTGVEKYLKDRG